jgi:arginine-tRNA-protein transferase
MEKASVTSEPRDGPQFYLTSPTPCPYLPGREERKVFTHLVGRRAIALNDALTESGFRRSQTIAYRPACEECRACVSVRVLVSEFTLTRNMRRVLEANNDLVGALLPPLLYFLSARRWPHVPRPNNIRCFAAISIRAIQLAVWPK